jgi:hypothetical protein
MSDSPVVPGGTEPAAGLSQIQRLLCVFTAPSKLFEDLKRSTTWWLPFLVIVAITYVFAFTVQAKVGWAQVTENVIQANPKTAAQMDKLPPEQVATQKKISATVTQVLMYVSPVVSILSMVVIAAVLMVTINFGFGGKASFGAALAVVVYAWLPMLIQSILATVSLLAGLAPESFNIQNFGGTNLAYYLSVSETPAALYKLAEVLDPIVIWTMVLLSMGLASVAGLKRRSGYYAVFGWWTLLTVIKVGWAAVMG